MTRSEASPRTVRLTTALLLVATFAAGTLSGAGLCRWLSFKAMRLPPPPMLPVEELGLTPAQRQKTDAILERHRPEIDAAIRDTFPKVRAIGEQIEREVREVLTPEQRTKFDQIKARRPPPAGPPPPGSPPGPWPPGPPPGYWMPQGPPPDAPE